jgi:hypothetical protein
MDDEKKQFYREQWKKLGGSFHGPHVETATITEESK